MNNYLTPSPISIHFSVDSPSGSPFERVQSHLQVQLQKEDASNKEVVESRETTISTVETHVDVALQTKPETEPIVEQNNTIVDKTPDTECCVCYNDFGAFHFKTHCNHNLCAECILQLPKPECPMCRSAFPGLLQKLLPLKDDDNDDDDDDDISNSSYLEENNNYQQGNNIIIGQMRVPDQVRSFGHSFIQEDNVQVRVIQAVPEPQPIPSYGFAWSGTPANY